MNDVITSLGGLLYDPDTEQRRLDGQLSAAEAKGLSLDAQIWVIQRHYVRCILGMVARGFVLCASVVGLGGLITQQWAVFWGLLALVVLVHVVFAVGGAVWMMRPTDSRD